MLHTGEGHAARYARSRQIHVKQAGVNKVGRPSHVWFRFGAEHITLLFRSTKEKKKVRSKKEDKRRKKKKRGREE